MSKIIDCQDILEVVQTIFSAPPQPPFTYQMEIHDMTPDSQHQLFQILGQFLTHGMTFLYGENPDTWGEVQIQTLQEYLHSIGWEAVIKPQHGKHYPNSLPYKLCIPYRGEYVEVIFEPYLQSGTKLKL